MNRWLCPLMCLYGVTLLVGCGGSEEQAPPEKAPEMSAEEQKNMEDQIQQMRDMQKK